MSTWQDQPTDKLPNKNENEPNVWMDYISNQVGSTSSNSALDKAKSASPEESLKLPAVTILEGSADGAAKAQDKQKSGYESTANPAENKSTAKPEEKDPTMRQL